MALKQMAVIHVSYCNGTHSYEVGRLAIKNHKTYFEYAPTFLESGIELSPFKLPLKPGVLVCEDSAFEGLFGVFNDSLPDGWGRLLLDRKLLHMGINPGAITPLDRLGYVGCHGMGALQYRPEIDGSTSTKVLADLDTIAEECLTIQETDTDTFVDDLLILNGSSAGARPKILVTLVQNKKKLERSENSLNTAHNDWIIKFRSSLDPKDIGSIEYAYHLMAVEAGLHVPEAKLFKSKKCAGYFGVKRFDRQKSTFSHMHTVSGLLHADHRIPSLDYETLMKTTFWLTKDIRECEKQFRNAVFNVLAKNRDDHAKNFSFLMDEKGLWTVSPAYDLTFSSGPAGEHCTTVMGEGRHPTTTHLLKLADVSSLKAQKAVEIIDQVKEAVARWPHFAKAAKVSSQSSQMIQTALWV